MKNIEDTNSNSKESYKKYGIVGIDFGTTTSAASFFDKKLNKVVSVNLSLQDGKEKKKVFSIIRFHKNGEVEILDSDKVCSINLIEKKDYVDIYSIKRLLGKSYQEALLDEGIMQDIKQYFHSIDDRLILRIFNIDYTPVQLAALIFQYIYKCYIINHVQDSISSEECVRINAMICMPVCFNKRAKSDILAAAELVRWKVDKILLEPVAACYASVIQKMQYNKTEEINNYIIFDLGGGTFDLSIVSILARNVLVSSVSGDRALGGDDIDIDLSKKLNSQFFISRYMKENLDNSSQDQTIILDIIKKYIDKAIVVLDNMLLSSRKKKFNAIVLVGGFAELEYLVNLLRSKYNLPIIQDDNASNLVASGAAYYASDFNKNYKLFEVLPLSIGIEVEEGIVDKVFNRNDRVPSQVKKKFGLKENQTHLQINIYQGEGFLVENCELLGKLLIDVKDKKSLTIEMLFTIDEMNILDIFFRHDDVEGSIFKKIANISLNTNSSLVAQYMQRFLKLQKYDYEKYQWMSIRNKFFILFSNLYKIFYSSQDMIKFNNTDGGILILFDELLGQFDQVAASVESNFIYNIIIKSKWKLLFKAKDKQGLNTLYDNIITKIENVYFKLLLKGNKIH